MKFTINNNDFGEGLKMVSKAIPKRTVLDVLKGVLIKTKDDCISLEAFDQEVHILTEVPAQIEEEGEILVPFNELFGFVSKSMQKIEVKTTENTVILKSSGAVKLSLLPVKQYPNLPEIPEVFTCQVYNLKDKIKKTLFLTEQTSCSFRAGVLFGNNRVVSTDGSHRVALIEADLNFEPIIIPGRLLSLISFWENAYVKGNYKRVYFKKDNTIVSCQGINSLFPNVEVFLNQEFRINISLDRERMLSICETALSINRGCFKINVNDNFIEFRSRSEMGEFVETMTIDEIIREPLELVINPQDLTMALKNIEEDEVTLHANESSKPIIVSTTNYKYITIGQVSSS